MTEAGFRKALDDDPTDVLARQVYADWLDEHGRYDNAVVQRLLGTRVVLAYDARVLSRRYPWDVFLLADDPLDCHLKGSFVTRLGSEWNVHLASAATRFGKVDVSRHSYPTPADAEADILRAYKALT